MDGVGGYFILCCIISVSLVESSGLQLNVIPPGNPSRGATVDLMCQITNPEIYAEALAVGRCNISWTRHHVTWNENSQMHIHETVLRTDGEITISVYRNEAGLPTRSILYITRMREVFQGTYLCHVNCPGLVNSAKVDVHLKDDAGDGLTVGEHRTAIIGTTAAIAVLCAFIITIVAYSVCDAYKRRRRPLSHGQGEAREAVEGGDDDDDDDLWLDLPPRYSVVIVMPPQPDSPTSPGNPDLRTRTLTRMLSRDKRASCAESVFLVDAPSYEEALQLLAAKGLTVDVHSLEPVPPAYRDIGLHEAGSHAGLITNAPATPP